MTTSQRQEFQAIINALEALSKRCTALEDSLDQSSPSGYAEAGDAASYINDAVEGLKEAIAYETE